MITDRINAIEKTIDKTDAKIDKMQTSLSEFLALVQLHQHDLYGNGKKGIVKKIEDLEKNVNENTKKIWGFSLIIGAISFLPLLKKFINNLIEK